VFFSKSGGAFIVNRKNKKWTFYLRNYFLKNYKTFYLMDYGFAPCEGFSNKNISEERFKIRTIREQEEIDIFCQYKGKKCLTRLFLDRLTPAKLFYYINYAMS
jgi:hypothetical protein